MNNGRLNDGGGEPRAPRPPAPRDGSAALAFKADVVLGAQLVSRHRAPRLAALLALALLVATVADRPTPAATRVPLACVVVGVLTAVGASRVFAPGGALAAARAAAGHWWIAPAGRLLGALAVIMPIGLAGASLLVVPGIPSSAVPRLSGILLLYGAVTAAFTAAWTPLVGSSVAAATGLITAWVGAVSPSGLLALLNAWPIVARPLVSLWNVLPLPWRAIRWFERGGPEDIALLCAWLAVAFLGAAWSVNRFYRTDQWSSFG
ncbi:MAG TPA: hypothetical protein VNL18_01345 [Gemmatimonadales bacterium]|nr:hypothetical protein [Gemmatimonadales bacterium]